MTFSRTILERVVLATTLLLLALVAHPLAAASVAPAAPAAPTITIADARFDGGDLLLTLDRVKAGGGITIQILIESGRTAATVHTEVVDVPPGAPSVDAVVSGLSGSLPVHGDQYRVRVVSPDGVEIARAQPLRTRLRCPAADLCTLEAWLGVDAGPAILPLPPALADALADASADASIDLDAIALARPDLRGDLYRLLWAVEVAEGWSASSNAPDGCVCLWTAGVSRSGTNRLITREWDAEPLSATAHADLAIDLLCVRPPSTETEPVDLPGGVVLDLDPLDDLDICPHTCDATVEFEVETVLGSVAAGGDEDPVFGGWSQASGETTAEWSVDGQWVDDQRTEAADERPALEDPHRVRSPAVALAQTMAQRPAPASARLDVTLRADAYAAPNGAGWAHGEAAVSKDSRVGAVARSSCLVGRPPRIDVALVAMDQLCCKDLVSLLDGNP